MKLSTCLHRQSKKISQNPFADKTLKAFIQPKAEYLAA